MTPHPPNPLWPGGANIAVQFVLNYQEGAESNARHDSGSETFPSEVIGAQSFPNRHMSVESPRRRLRSRVRIAGKPVSTGVRKS